LTAVTVIVPKKSTIALSCMPQGSVSIGSFAKSLPTAAMLEIFSILTAG
jgi:hypothetical protein